MSESPSSRECFSEEVIEAAEWYERGLALRKAGLFKQAIEQLEKATNDQQYALKAYAQIGLCCKSTRQYDAAVIAFRNALKVPAASTKETVQLLYVLGRTLESLGRIGEALEVYRWLRREDAEYRDVGERISILSVRRAPFNKRQACQSGSWTTHMLQSCRDLLLSTK